MTYQCLYQGNFNSLIGADSLEFKDAYNVNWTEIDGYDLIEVASSADQLVYYGIKEDSSYNFTYDENTSFEQFYAAIEDATNGADPLFKFILNEPDNAGDGTWDFVLLDPAPAIIDEQPNALSGFSNNNSPEVVQISSSDPFGNYFYLEISGRENWNETTGSFDPLDVKVSNTDLGIGSNASKPNEELIIDIVEEQITSTRLRIGASCMRE